MSMPQEIEAAPVTGLVSLVVPAEVRMTVSAADPDEADEILRAMFGGGDWMKAMLDMGWKPPITGIKFAIRLQ